MKGRNQSWRGREKINCLRSTYQQGEKLILRIEIIFPVLAIVVKGSCRKTWVLLVVWVDKVVMMG